MWNVWYVWMYSLWHFLKLSEIRFSGLWGQRIDSAYEDTRVWILVPNTMVLGMGNHLRPVSEASDWVVLKRFHFLKSSLTSYSPTTQFLVKVDLRLLKRVPNDSPPKHRFCQQNHVSSNLRSWDRISLLEVLLVLLFMAFRSIWGFWTWSQMIPNTPKHWCCHWN